MGYEIFGSARENRTRNLPIHAPAQPARFRRFTVRISLQVLWVPTWTWHRVDYLPGVSAISASLFHFRAEQVATHNPLFTSLLVPNIAKELVGWKTQ